MSGSALVLGFGTVGSAATRYLLDCGVAPGDVTVVEVDTDAAQRAVDLGVRAILGDATHRFVLAQAISEQVRQVIIAVVPDETAVLTTMVARELCPSATIVTAVREETHLAVVCRLGADHAVVTAEVAGDALAEALLNHRPPASTPWTIDQRPARSSEIGRPMHDCDPHPVGLIRGGRRHWGLDAARLHVAPEDVLVFLRTHTLTEN